MLRRKSTGNDLRPRIAIVTDAIFPYHKGGKEVRYRELAKRLAGSGFEVTVFTMNWWSGPRERVESGVRYRAICRRYDLYHGERRSFVEAFVFSIACFKLLTHRFDAIEADHMPYLQLFPLRIVAWLKRARFVVTWHEFWGRDYWRAYLGRLGAVAATIERLSTRLPDHIVVEAMETRVRLIESGVAPGAISMVPVGIDGMEIATAPMSDQRFDLLFVGRLIQHKNVDLLLEAVAALRATGVTVRCGVVGDGPQKAALEQQAFALGIVDAVTFLGVVESHSEIFGLMKSAGALVLPSEREGFGLVVIESLACGTPVVTVDHRDNQARVLVDDGVTGVVCAPTTDELAAAIRRVLDPRTGIAAEPQATLATFDWSVLIGRLGALYAIPRGGSPVRRSGARRTTDS